MLGWAWQSNDAGHQERAGEVERAQPVGARGRGRRPRRGRRAPGRRAALEAAASASSTFAWRRTKPSLTPRPPRRRRPRPATRRGSGRRPSGPASRPPAPASRRRSARARGRPGSAGGTDSPSPDGPRRRCRARRRPRGGARAMAGSGTGEAARSDAVYGWRGAAKSVALDGQLHHPAGVDHGDPVAEVLGHQEVVQDHHVGRAELLAQACQQVQDLRLDRDVEGRDRLVEQHQVGVEDEGPGQGDPLALAARELVRPPARGRRVEPDQLQHLADPRLALGAGADAVDHERLLEQRSRPAGAGRARRTGPGRRTAGAGAGRAARRWPRRAGRRRRTGSARRRPR